MRDFDKLEFPRDGQIIVLFWSDGSITLDHEWRFGKINWDAKIHPIGWCPIPDDDIENICSSFDYDA